MPNTALRLSPEGLAFIKRFQGFSAEPYQDECHLWVIGYGHLIEKHEAFPTPITREHAEALLQQDIQACRRALARAVRVPLTQHQYDALVSLALSVGPQAFAHTHVVAYFNQRQNVRALAAWLTEIELNGIRSNGLNRQRQAECALFRTGFGGERLSAE